MDARCAGIVQRSPPAIAIAKRSFNVDSGHIGGVDPPGFEALRRYYDTDESREDVSAPGEKRAPDFRRYAQ